MNTSPLDRNLTGHLRIDEAAQTVTHTVEGAMVQDWVGTKLVRRYRFLTPDRVELSVVPDAQLPAPGLGAGMEKCAMTIARHAASSRHVLLLDVLDR